MNMNEQDMRKLQFRNWEGKIVRHFKGDLYMIIDVAEHTETGEEMVVYRALYDDCKLYVRPFEMFIEKCTDEQFEEYQQKYRFIQVDCPSQKM